MIVSRNGEPAYGGVGTFCKAPLALRPEELEGVDVAIVGAPFDEGVSYRPGARFGPRAIREADNFFLHPPSRPHMYLGVDAFAELKIVDYGDAECPPADLLASHAEIKARVTEILQAGVIPVVLGGDHSLAYPDITVVAEHFGKGQVGVIQFDAHADTAPNNIDRAAPHGVGMRRVVEEGFIRGEHFIQVGLHGYFPNPEDFDWMRSVGMRWYTAEEIDERGMAAVADELVSTARSEFPDAIFISFDIDVFDGAFAPGTGAPEPGGLTPREVLPALRRVFRELPIIGMELVEVAPAYDPAAITPILAHRCILEALSALALRRTGHEPRPQFSAVTA
jgi:agmatinase